MKRGFLTSSPKTRRSSEMAARQHVVADEGVGPDRPHQAFFGHDLTGLRSQAHQHLHDLRFQASGAGGARHTVERRLDVMELADAKAVLQRFAQCAKRTSRFYSTDSARLSRRSIHRLPLDSSEVGQHPDVALPGPSCDGKVSAVRRWDRGYQSSLMG